MTCASLSASIAARAAARDAISTKPQPLLAWERRSLKMLTSSTTPKLGGLTGGLTRGRAVRSGGARKQEPVRGEGPRQREQRPPTAWRRRGLRGAGPAHGSNTARSSASPAAGGACEKNSWRLSSGPSPACTYWWLRAKRTCGGGGGGRAGGAGALWSSRGPPGARQEGAIPAPVPKPPPRRAAPSSAHLRLAARARQLHAPVEVLARRVTPVSTPALPHTPTPAHLRLAARARQLHAPVEVLARRVTPVSTPALPHTPTPAHLQLAARARQLHAPVELLDRRLRLLARRVRHERAAARLAGRLVLE
jgi:hypothetical protein